MSTDLFCPACGSEFAPSVRAMRAAIEKTQGA